MHRLCNRQWNRYIYFSWRLRWGIGVSTKNNGEKGWNEFDSTTGSLYYTYHNLKPRDLEFFKSLPYKKELELEGLLPITICHGSPQKVNEKLLKTGEISHGTVLARAMAICEEKYGACSWPDVPEECWKMAVDEL